MTLIENLEKLSDEYLSLYTDLGDRADLRCSEALDEAINIVKEHKCTWKGIYNYRKETTVQLTNIKSGNVKDLYSPSVYGVGVVGTKYPISVNSRNTKEYYLWNNMLMRCYSTTYKKKRPTYECCKVSDKFKSYEYFYEWCHKQIGFNEEWHLDKDLLIKGNKVYSESTCVFIPKEINLLLTKREASRGEYIIGVCWSKTHKAFKAQVGKSKGKQEHLGYFNTELEAFKAYKQAKESFVKEQANKWKDKIDPRAYNALMNYEVNIDD